jgi:hypothetical protein
MSLISKVYMYKWDNWEQIAVVQTPLINVVNQLYSDYGSFFSHRIVNNSNMAGDTRWGGIVYPSG